MATYRVKKRKDGSPSQQKRPWRARVKVDWVEYFLGYYETKEEAEQAERDFKAFDYGT
jgi:hypothetical protein